MPVTLPPELRHQVKARQGGFKAGAQRVAQLRFDQAVAGQQPQPQAQCTVIARGHAVRFGVGGRGHVA
jgi:hypothetical protein